MGISILCIYTFVQFQQDIGINKEKEICLSNKESLIGYSCGRPNLVAKYEKFMKFLGIFKTNMTAKQEMLKGL